MRAVQTTHVRVGDYDVSLQSAGSGPPLLLLHGAGGAGMWLDLHARLAEHFTVFAPIEPGFAGTPLPGWVRAADDVALHTLDLMCTLGLDSPVVVGLSLGGWIATEMAVFRPRSIRRLVLVAPIGVKTEKPLPDLFIMEPLEALPYLFADVSKAMALMPAALTPDAIVRMWEEQAAVARLAWHRPYNPSLRRRLHMIECPTLVVWGSEDRFVSPAHGEMLAGEIPGARLEVIPGAGHAVGIERPDELAQKIVAFVADRREG
ncbi:MAG TPA: alpha/beta fold hydrolase [Candidatus Binatia bacterium]|nr:alpha/beta fold hydrolase [Candidatus Binatia bacterium]